MYLTKDSPELKDLSTQELKNLLGGKGAGLVQMANQGLPVPPFVVFPTTVWEKYSTSPKTTMKLLSSQLKAVQKHLGVSLLSVRSGARVSCPGMMDTILNVGLDDQSYDFWQQKLGTQCVIDSRKRLLQMYGQVVKGIPKEKLEAKEYIEVAAAYMRATGEDQFPSANDQLLNSIEAVFKSWHNARAVTYRKLNNIPDSWGTAVVIQSMVFGNLNNKSGTGVLFTRNPDTGADEVTGEFLVNAQGEDVVAGVRTPLPLNLLGDKLGAEVSNQLLNTVENLETLNKDVQDVEFTIQDGKLYILQTRTAKRSAKASVKIALDMFKQGLITADEARSRVSAREIDLADMPTVDPTFKVKPDFVGIPACSGVAEGIPVFSSSDAVKQSTKGSKVILITKETTPDDLAGMIAAVGVITMEGGSTSHAAVVARAMNKPCVVGVGKDLGDFSSDLISFCGASGRIWKAKVPVVETASKYVQEMRDLMIGQGTLITSEVPKFFTQRVLLDLSRVLHLDMAAIEKLVKDTSAKCDSLVVKVTQPDQKMAAFYSVLMTEPVVKARIMLTTILVDSMNDPKITVMGWKSDKHPAIDCVDNGQSLEALIMIKKTGLLANPPLDTPAVKKVLQWLKADGVVLETMNSAGGYATWSVHANG